MSRTCMSAVNSTFSISSELAAVVGLRVFAQGLMTLADTYMRQDVIYIAKVGPGHIRGSLSGYV